MLNYIRLSLLLVVVAFGLVGCGTAPRVSIVADADANQHAPTALDFVIVHDASLITALPDDSTAWFAKKNTLSTRLADGLHVVSMEVPPGMTIERVVFPKNTHQAAAVFYYANYSNPTPQARGSIRPDADVTLCLKAAATQLSHNREPR